MERLNELSKYCRDNGIMLNVKRSGDRTTVDLQRGSRSARRGWRGNMDNIGFKECLLDAKRIIENEKADKEGH